MDLEALIPPDDETIEEMVCGRRPRVGEWVNCFHPVQNGDAGVRRAFEHPSLGQVLEIKDGDYQNGGVQVRIWEITAQGFVEEFFAPWCCITSRAAVTKEYLAGAWA